MSKATKFSQKVEEYAVENDVSYIEALLKMAEEKEIDFKNIKTYISKSLYDKIEQEAEEKNILNPTNKLTL